MRSLIPKLHNQILIALILGAVLGSVLNVEKNILVIKYKSNGKILTTTVKNWSEIIFTGREKNVLGTFYGDQQLEIITACRKLKNEKAQFSLEVYTGKPSSSNFTKSFFNDVISMEKETTIAVKIKWIGDIFIRLLTMIAIPLVLASLIVGAASLGDIKKFARIGGKTITFYLVTTALAITIGLIVANTIKPGIRMTDETKNRLLSVYQEDTKAKLETEFEFDLSQEIVNIVPKNPIYALANSEMLQIVFFAVFFGLALSLIKKEKAKPVVKFFDGLSDVMIKLVEIVMLIAPIGVFALIAATVSEFGFDILQTLVWYMLAVIIGLIIHTFGIYSLLIKIFTKMSPLKFFKGLRKAQTIAFSTSSSAATLPVNIKCCQENLGVSKSITSFVLPLGATINMDGTALYQGVAAVFIAQVFNVDLTIFQQLTIVFTATLASIGTAPVPGVGIIMLIVVLKSVGIPEEGIALIIGVDRILDMCRTVTNITGDAAVAAAVATSENEIVRTI